MIIRKKRPRKNGQRNPKHKLWILEVTARDGRACLSCGTKRRAIVRYIFSYQDCPNRAYDINNGLTLCTECYWLLKDNKDYEKLARKLIMEQKFKNKENENGKKES